MIRKTWPLLLLCVATARASFQSDFTGARAAALGGAVSADAKGAADLFTNPAALAGIAASEISLMYGKPFSGLDGVDIGQGAATLGLPSRWGNWGLGATAFKAAGAKEERVLAASYAVGLAGGRIQAGGTVKHMSHRYLISGAAAQNDPLFRNGGQKSAVDFDLGLSGRVAGPLSAGATVRNIRGADVGLATRDRLSRETQAGLALDLTGWGLKASGDMAFASSSGEEGRMRPAFGVEKSLYKDTFALRAGANRDRFATGLGVVYNRLFLDYTLVFNRTVAGADSSSHQVQMTWRFSK